MVLGRVGTYDWWRALTLGSPGSLAIVAIYTSYATLLPLASIAAEVVPQKKPPYTEWALVAGADVIAKGKLLTANKSRSDADVCTYSAETFLKGKLDAQKIEIRQPVHSDQTPSRDTLRAIRGKPSIVFLTKNNTMPSKPDNYSIPQKKGIQNLGDVDIKSISAEMENEKLINAHFAKLPVAQTDQFDHIISKLFLQLQSPSTAEQALAKLDKLPEDVVPAIIRTMTLSPRLCQRRIQSEGTPQGAPGSTVETILLDMCTKKTGMSFPDQEGWRTWLFYTSPESPQ